MPRQRIRELGISIGHLPTGPLNAITDIPGVQTGQHSIVHDKPTVARTGVTVILPNKGNLRTAQPFAGCYAFNGNGDMTGVQWIEESGLLSSPVAITNTHQVGVVRDALIAWEVQHKGLQEWMLPAVAETYDGYLNDINAQHVTREDVFRAMESASGGPVMEGNSGGGTGMICHGFKGGTGTSSRIVKACGGEFVVGCLVQANYGLRSGLRLNGVPIGRLIDESRIPSAWPDVAPKDGSIIGIIGTNAPLLPNQCRRLAQRAVVGLARAGGVGYNSSGDLFLAFATGNSVPAAPGPNILPLQMLPHSQLDPFFDAVAETMEESIWNALTMAETMTGLNGRTAHAIPLDILQEVYERHAVNTD